MSTQRTVLVTGGSRGIGRAISQRFASAGHRVCVLAKHPETLARALAWSNPAGPPLVGICVDLEDAAAVPGATQAALRALGGSLDVLINNAGLFDMAPIERTTLEVWNRFLAVNLTAPFLVTQACLPALRESSAGHIINISSIAGRQGFPQNTAYCTTKYGLRGFSDAL
ncbi:MAG TPA: SDR family oxidoreductase, partial [Planctomycetota bacterium]|nr:SDR family oxidoreductase [Planctomycetota bacterium]